MRKPFTAPAHLQPPETELFNQIQREFGINDASGLALLAAACESQGRARKCRESIDLLGEITAEGKVHPLLATERNSRKDFVLTIAALGLDVESAGSIGAPSNNLRRIK